ncbi:alpha/beta hydrolase family protein [Streptoverticillium reticulum]|uniref:S9 family peptidase n=1 Tax=Streptoverticillium reticulum TaxID=1433415 RepID=UPI0039BF8426
MTGFARTVHALLNDPAGTVTGSAGEGYGWAVHRHRYPPAVPGDDSAPAGLRTGQLETVSPDGRHWAPPELHDVLGQPAHSAGRFAGTALVGGEPRCWIADVRARRVRLLDTPAAMTAGDGTPVAWSGGALVLPAAAPARLREPQYLFEAVPGQRIRMALAEATAEHLRLHYRFADPASGTLRHAGLAPRGYRDVRATARGAVAAHAPGLVAAAWPDGAGEQVIELDGAPLLDFQWLGGLVLVTGHADGFDIVSWNGAARRVLHRHHGRFLHSDHAGLLTVLAQHRDGGHAVVVVDGGAVHVAGLDGHPVTPLQILAVGPRTADRMRFATLHAGNEAVMWSMAPGATAAVPLSRHALPGSRRPVTVRRWQDVAFGGVTVPETPSAAAPAPVRLRTGRSGTEAYLHLPRGPAAGVLVWLSQAAGRYVPLGPDPAWLALDGHAVLDLRLDLGWWRRTPDERIRPRIVRQIREGVLRSGLDRYTGPVPLAVGGTSFGATLALIALADCDLFGAGVAQSGAYSRHLTALGFQDETRSLWEAPGLYRDVDAIVRAPDIRMPVLIIHGEDDRNPATPLTQALLLFQALAANGTRARLAVLPGEGHTVRTREGLAASLAAKSHWLTTTGKEASTRRA